MRLEPILMAANCAGGSIPWLGVDLDPDAVSPALLPGVTSVAGDERHSLALWSDRGAWRSPSASRVERDRAYCQGFGVWAAVIAASIVGIIVMASIRL